jgi:aminopeptidase N
MEKTKPNHIFLSNYKTSDYEIDNVYLTFKLHPTKTIVLSKMTIIPIRKTNLFLNGIELKLKDLKINGHNSISLIKTHDDGISFQATDLPDQAFSIEITTEINPKNNTSLEGLYISNGMYCTQCEAEGFRKITYYLDRPDIMATFKVRVESNLSTKLSNGDKIDEGNGWAEWEDPWPKPSYLFALVAGELQSIDDYFVTKSGRKVILKIWVRKEDINKCTFAMNALKRSMLWDEVNYDREYDLSIFQIVAVDDFNMGAMENKGLNIFNSKYVLASPETATDNDYKLIEGIIAHEYFHNWTGNRITCRDWFQLSLKEGLTVFRDQQFSADQRGSGVKRINDVIQLRNRQFEEDKGPLAHPVRPVKYKEINNFYTATIYEKGAELINMLHKLVGPKAYKETLNLYFERHDGEACTIEDWLKVFEDHNNIDLKQFKLWYEQAGTPIVTVQESFENFNYTLKFTQEIMNNNTEPMLIPISVGLLNKKGKEVIETSLLKLSKSEQEFTFNNIKTKPIPSILRDFSAPVIINYETTDEQNAFLLQFDTNEFNKWEAGQKLARSSIIQTILEGTSVNTLFAKSVKKFINNRDLEPTYRAVLLKLPTQESLTDDLIMLGRTPDPLIIYNALITTQIGCAKILKNDFIKLFKELQITSSQTSGGEDSGNRDLHAALLKLNTYIDHGKLAFTRYNEAENMTDLQSAFISLMSTSFRKEIISRFYDSWKHDKLVIDKWFSLQTVYCDPKYALETTKKLTKHQDFDYRNPNRFRSLIGSFCSGNPVAFHVTSGEGYEFAADWIIKQDKINPQTAARLCSVFQSWKKYDKTRQNNIKLQLNRILNIKVLSKDTKEMIDRMVI